MTNRIGILTILLLVLLLGIFPAAPICAQAPSRTYPVTASAGARLQAPSGRMTLDIPPGALPGDTEITITEEETAGGTQVGYVYNIEPDGLILQKPAALMIRYDAEDVPEGMSMEDVAITQITMPDEAQAGADIPAGWEYLNTWVDPRAGTVSVQIEHFSRYGARAYASYRLGEFEQRNIVGPFDFGMKFAQSNGAGSAEANFGLLGELFVRAGVPVGSNGQAMAHADLTKWFRIKPGRDGQTSTDQGTISVTIRHQGQMGADTNQYNIVFATQCYDESPVGMGTPYVFESDADTQGRYRITGLLNQAYAADPLVSITEFPMGPPYQPGTYSMMFRDCELEAGKFYAITVGLTASVSGSPPVPEGGVPARGGSVEFMAPPDRFLIESIQVEA